MDWERKSQVIDVSLIGVVAAGTNLGNAFLRCTCKEPLHCSQILKRTISRTEIKSFRLEPNRNQIGSVGTE